MKIKELNNMKKRIYIDMDGTLCDFKGELAKKQKYNMV
jgi:hydroxymethylpyrimidine pyrophosphatase-like HAD family hydrolase